MKCILYCRVFVWSDILAKHHCVNKEKVILMNKRNRAQVRLMKDLEELQNDPPYVSEGF